MPTVDLYYSQSLMGHFTIIAYDKVELIAYRVHFVDKDAEASHGSLWTRASHKLVQATGFAMGLALSDWMASPAEFQERINYAANGRTRVKSWNVTVQAMDSMLLWTHRFVQDQTQGHYGSYGYVIYSSNVDNCGSFAIKCLHEAGIDITLTGLKSWLPFPSLIKGNV